jgi:hypothetical protein
MWPYVVHILVIGHRPLLSIRVPRVCAHTSSRGGRGKWVSIRATAEQRISCSSVPERDRRVTVIRVELAELSKVPSIQQDHFVTHIIQLL